MTFTELPFWILTALTYALWLLGRHRYPTRVGVLLTASIVFYGYHKPALLLVLLAYCLVDWGVARWIAVSRRPRAVLALGVSFNLVVLAYWKYTPLLLRSAAALAGFFDRPAPPTASADWIIPFGLSFYAFTGIAYLVDVYRGETPVERIFVRYLLSAIFFPHLVAGPILRPHDFLTRLGPATMPERAEAPLEALHLLARGFFKKLVLADRLALAIDPFFAHVGDVSTAGVWSLPYVYLYALQIYFDFSGYTDIARGLGLLFGFRWPENFDLPYLAGSVQEFWRRWHITLSLFLRDYLYLPLGGSRRGRVRTYANLMATMLLGGLWHGASWSFLLWGGLHGVFLVINRLWTGLPLYRRLNERGRIGGALWRIASVVLTFHCVCLAWCFFRLTVLADSLACVRKAFVFDTDKLLAGDAKDVSLWLLVALYAAGVWAAPQVGLSLRVGQGQTSASFARGFAWTFGLTLMLLAVCLSPGGAAPPFIYFQF
jgi:D-alanyl-lipoteichoic acid acyltransferase DltB (MBOAT superfamily)